MKLKPEQIDKIREAYELGYSLSETARYVHCHEKTVSKYLKSFGLRPHYCKNYPRLADEQVAQIIRAHSMGYSTIEAANYVGVHYSTIYEYWRKADLVPNIHYRRISAVRIDKIKKAHELGYTQCQTADYTNLSRSTIQKYWHLLGLGTLRGRRRISEEKNKMIMEAYQLGYNTRQAAEYAHVSRNTISKYWKATRLQVNSPGYQPISEEKIEKLKKAYRLGYMAAKAAKYSNVAYPTCLKYWKIFGFKCPKVKYKVPLTHLLDGVFDTCTNQNELLTYDDIKERLEELHGVRYEDQVIEAALDTVVELGIYNRHTIDGVTKYGAEMSRILWVLNIMSEGTSKRVQ